MFFKMPFKVRNVEIYANFSMLLLPHDGFSTLLAGNELKNNRRG